MVIEVVKGGAGGGVGRKPTVTAAQWTQSSQVTPGPEGGDSPGFAPVQVSSKAAKTIARAWTRRKRDLGRGDGEASTSTAGQSAVTTVPSDRRKSRAQRRPSRPAIKAAASS